jgi:hypothetical protein
MRLIQNILISIVAGVLSGILGWFSGYAVGVRMEPSDQSLGSGLPTVFLMYVFALAFCVIGFFVCLLWRLKKNKSNSDANES